MNVECTKADGYNLVTCEGKLDESTQRAFRDSVHPLFAEKGVKVVIDLSATERINSDGMAAMLRLVSDAKALGCHVVFASPSAFVEEVLQRTRLNSLFDIAPSREEAVAQLQAGDAAT